MGKGGLELPVHGANVCNRDDNGGFVGPADRAEAFSVAVAGPGVAGPACFGSFLTADSG